MSWGVIAGDWGIMGEDWRKGPWTAEEDKLLIEHVRLHGEGKWNSVARLAGLKRNGKSCRLRWVNYLRPDLKRGHITPQEESIILELHARWGNRWSRIARSLPGRTDNEIKNYWRTRFRKKVKSSLGNHEKQKTQLLIRRQQFQQQQQQQQPQMNQVDMKKIMFLVDESENRVPYVAQVRQDHMENMYTHTADQEEEFLYSNVSELEAWNEDIILWDGLWDLDDVHANFSAASATNKASLHNLVAPFC